MTLLAARKHALAAGGDTPLSTLVAYASDQTHSACEKATIIAGVQLRVLDTDPHGSLRADTLRAAIEADVRAGRRPFFLCATVGTTGVCAVDRIDELAPVCSAADIWLHIDAAYAGSAAICPEFRHHFAGLDGARSVNFNPHKVPRRAAHRRCTTGCAQQRSLTGASMVCRCGANAWQWLKVNFDCSALWYVGRRPAPFPRH